MTHICHRERRERKGKEKTSEKEKEKEKKAERSTVKMYYWNVALSEHCEEVPLECGSVHWNTEEVCEVAPFTQCHCWDEEAAQFRQERELQKVASQQIVRQPLVVAYQQKELQSCYMVPPYHSSILDHTTFRVTWTCITAVRVPAETAVSQPPPCLRLRKSLCLRLCLHYPRRISYEE